MKQKTLKVLGVIGDPISHSLSPLMQNAALADQGLTYLYMPFHVKPEELESFCQNASEHLIGFNVTIPHKQTILPYLHSISREARLIGAVNTVIVKSGKLFGHNTDAAGYALSLEKEAGFEIKGKHITVLGAGGSARAIATAMGLNGAREMTFLNRTAKKAFDLASEFGKKFPKTVFSAGSLDEIGSHDWAGTDLLVNATALGMGSKKHLKLPLTRLPSHALVSDIVYTPLETPLLRSAKRAKVRTHAGWGMLLYQGALAFELWTKKKAPVAVMKEALLNALKKKR